MANIATRRTTIGASNHNKDREPLDFYATHPSAILNLLNLEKFRNDVWEVACGEGHLSKELVKEGYNVKSTDIVNRGYERQFSEVDFLKTNEIFEGDIITNPPYSHALEFVKKSLETVTEGGKVAMLLRLQFLEGKARKRFFNEFPPIRVWVSSSRLPCAKNADFTRANTAIALAWFIWEKGNNTKFSQLKWF